MWKVVFTKQAAKDAKKLKAAGLDGKAKKLIDVVRKTLLQTPPAYEALVGNLSGYYSRRISIQHRFVYSIEQSADAHDGAPCDFIVKSREDGRTKDCELPFSKQTRGHRHR